MHEQPVTLAPHGTANRHTQEIDLRFLEGPRSRWKEFKSIVSIASEFIYGFRKLHCVGPCVAFFGSARFMEDHPYYQAAQELAARVGQVGFTIMTGGGPGIMEAANRGARDVGARSVACGVSCGDVIYRSGALFLLLDGSGQVQRTSNTAKGVMKVK